MSTSRWGGVRAACVLRIGNRSGPHVRHRRGQIVMGARARIALILLNTTMVYDERRMTIETPTVRWRMPMVYSDTRYNAGEQ